MPEGHLIHRYARRQRRELGGSLLEVSSPQGRFAREAESLDGRTLAGVEAYGKHLIYDLGELVHVHLGMAGVWFPAQGEPRPSVRLRLAGPRAIWDLVAPNRCELYTPQQREALFARLGADPLRRDADPAIAFDRLRRSKLPLGAALLDQRIIAGIGNVIRSELLFELGLDPDMPATAVQRELFDRLWTRLVEVMRTSVRRGRIVFPEAPAGRRHVYKESSCARCAGPIDRRTVGGRTAYVCPTCQRAV